MAAQRMLVLLSRMENGDAAAQTVLRALHAAARPYGMRFLVSSAFREAFSPHQTQIDALRANAVLFSDAAGSPGDALPHLTDETHFLFLMGAHDFAPRWDAALWDALRAVPERDALLTACVRPPTGESRTSCEPLRRSAPTSRAPFSDDRPTRVMPKLGETASPPFVPAEAYLPALSPPVAENTFRLCYGLPLVCAAQPVRTLLIDPALLLGSVDFLKSARLTCDTLSIAAYMAGIPVYALPQPALWPLHEASSRVLTLPAAMAGSSLGRFEQLVGLRREVGRTAVKTAWGLFGVEDAYKQRMPRSIAAVQRLRATRMRLRENQAPLLITAFIDLPTPQPADPYVLRFGFLKEIRSLPLLLYTGGRQERALRASFPNTLSYPDNNLLPKSLLFGGMTAEQHFRRSKPLLLLRSALRHPELTHVAWVDADVLPHPVCPDAAPDFSALMDDRIHIATIDGVPDASFVIVPTEHAALLAKETKSLTLLDAELKRSLDEPPLWQRLIQKFPDLFTLHPMPGRRLLFLTAFHPQLLGQRLRVCLREPNAPISPQLRNERKDVPHVNE